MPIYKHVLHPTDLTETCLDTAKKALALAKYHQATFSLIHCIEPLPAYGAPGLVDLQSPFIDRAKVAMGALAEKIGVPADQQFIEFGSTKKQVVKLAESLKIDLIIVGSHGHGALGRLLGSTANGIIHAATCDVLTIRC